MKSVGGFLRNVVQRKDAGLTAKTLQVGPYNVRVEAHLGDGGFAAIYRVRDMATPAVYALKHMRLGADPEALQDCHAEVDIMQRLRDNAHVLRLRAVAYMGPKGQEEEAFLLLDLCRHNLVDHMRQINRPLRDADVVIIFQSVCKAVAAMHEQDPPLIHRDLKAENVLQHSNGSWVLCDFGSTTSWSGHYEGTTDIMVAEEEIRKYTTLAYRPPEMVDLYSREHIGREADIWSLGVLLFYMCFQTLPFEGDCKLQVLNGDFNCPSGRPQGLVMLVKSMLKVSPASRPAIGTVLHRLQHLTLAPSPRQPMKDSEPPRAVSNAKEGRHTGMLATQHLSPSSQAAPPSSGAWDMGGWELNAWEKPFTSVSSPRPMSQVNMSDSSNPGLGATSQYSRAQLSPRKERADAQSAGNTEHPKKSSTRCMRTGLPTGAPTSRPISPSPSPLLPISEADDGSHPFRVSPASLGHSPDAAEAGVALSDIFSLQQQLAEAKATNGRLSAIIKQQQMTISHLQGHSEAWEAQVRDANSLKPATGGASISAGAAGVSVLSSVPLQGTPQQIPSSISPIQSSGRKAVSEQQSLSPDHPLKSLEESLIKLDPFAASEQPNPPSSVASGNIKKAPSRFGMKSRGSSFTAFEDEYDPDLDLANLGHLKMNSATEHSQEGSSLPTTCDGFAQDRQPDVMQMIPSAGNACKHRRTTSEPTPLDSWEPRTEWP